jgi:hypothetical protein
MLHHSGGASAKISFFRLNPLDLIFKPCYNIFEMDMMACLLIIYLEARYEKDSLDRSASVHGSHDGRARHG